jgi:hypothetical protein
LLERKTVAALNNPLGQSVHLNDRTIGVDHDDAGRDLVKRASRDNGFPSQLPEPELNFGCSAKWLQQSIQTFEVRCAKRLFANSFVYAEYDCLRSGIADLSSDDISHSALQHEVIVPFAPAQFRFGQLFGEPHPCPLMPREEIAEGIFGCKAGDVVRRECGAGTQEICPIDPASTRVSDDIRRSDGAQSLGDRS